MLYESGEDYLETILLLDRESTFVRSVDVAEKLGYTKPSVSRAMGLLRRAGYITMEKSGRIVLTESGRETAEGIYRRHTLLTAFFARLGVSEETAAADACRIEHVVSPETLARIEAFMQT